jgi:hypothetical protein
MFFAGGDCWPDWVAATLSWRGLNTTVFCGSFLRQDGGYPSKSKPILDEIDRELARHYGFAAEELDFILNYDIKYRLGRDTETRDD